VIKISEITIEFDITLEEELNRLIIKFSSGDFRITDWVRLMELLNR